MNIVDVAKDYVPLANLLVLVLFLGKYLLDLRRWRLEREKLERELKALREGEVDATAKILQASADSINHLVIGPLVDTIRKRDRELEEAHRRLLEAFFTAARNVHDNAERRDKAMEDGQRRVLEAFYSAASSIRENMERASFGGKWTALIQENTRALDQLRERLGADPGTNGASHISPRSEEHSTV
jgi:hypothetical protein